LVSAMMLCTTSSMMLGLGDPTTMPQSIMM
jgi:hypothetical protein